jgi:hypothetical protein
MPMAEWVRLRNLQAGAGGDVISVGRCAIG